MVQAVLGSDELISETTGKIPVLFSKEFLFFSDCFLMHNKDIVITTKKTNTNPPIEIKAMSKQNVCLVILYLFIDNAISFLQSNVA